MATIKAPYLEAIQSVPGDTPAEKYQWISRLISDQFRARGESAEVDETKEVPEPLIPFVKAEAAKKLKRCDGIVEALMSEDSIVVNKALQAKWFFDGSNRDVLNADYFSKNLFPFVSLKTRSKMLKKMAAHMNGQRPDVAEEFFVAVDRMYGIDQAYPLLAECSEEFIYNTVVQRELILPRKLLKRLFVKNPDLVVRYFKLSKPEPGKKNRFTDVIYNNSDILAKLMKRRLEAFLELYEMHEKHPPKCQLSNKCAYYFMKNARESLTKKPQLYMDLIPLKMIDAKRLEIILPKLFPVKRKDFSTDKFISLLTYYPEDQKANLIIKAYNQVYGKNILDCSDLITHEFMSLLPAEERVRQARIKMENEPPPKKGVYSVLPWHLYLPTEETIPQIKDQIAHTSVADDRLLLLQHLLMTCKVNKDDNALLGVLEYIQTRHRNEQAWVQQSLMSFLAEKFQLHKLSEAHWKILYDIVRRGFVRNDFPPNYSTLTLLKEAIHFRLDHKMEFDQVIDMAADCSAIGWGTNWTLLIEIPEYARICLDAFARVVERKIDTDESWKPKKVDIPVDLYSSYCSFNEKLAKNSKVEKLNLKNYPWLMQRLETIAKSTEQDDRYARGRLKDLLKTHDKELFLIWFPDENSIADVTTGDAIARLKQDPQSILDNCALYMKKCQDNHYRRSVWSFLRATRWYKDISMKFVEECFNVIQKGEKPVSFFLLALLLHGQTYTELIDPYVPNEKIIKAESNTAKADYFAVTYIASGIKISNPPVPLELVGRLCGGDYMSPILSALTSISRRTSLTKVMPFATALTDNKVSVKKHGIRLVCMVSSIEETANFLSSSWTQETHPSIREVLYQNASNLFFRDPNPITWRVIKHFISNLTSKDANLLTYVNKIERVARDYVVDYVVLVLDLVDRLPEMGFDEVTVEDNKNKFLTAINGDICNSLTEDVHRRLLKLAIDHSPNEVPIDAFVIVYLRSSRTQDILKARLASFLELFSGAIKAKWNVAHPKLPNCYPMNYGVNQLISNMISNFSYKQKADSEKLIIDEFMKMFLSCLGPTADPASYLMLLFAQYRFSCEHPSRYGLMMGADFPRLTNVFSSAFFVIVPDVVQQFLNCNVFSDFDEEEIMLGFREGMLNSGKVEAVVFVAAEPCLSLSSPELKERYEELLKKLRGYDLPAVKSALAYRVNSVSCSSV